jgi:hypothetical protein
MPSKNVSALTVALLTGLAALIPSNVSSAVPVTNGIKLYFSAPFIQGPSYSGSDVQLETFDSFSTGTGTCLGASAVGEIMTTCSVFPGNGSGGAATTGDTPTVGGTRSNYAGTPWPSGGAEIEILFPEGRKFIGLWWSAGNVESSGGTTNTIEFYDGDSLLATMTANQVMDKLGGAVPNPYPGSATLETVGGGSHNIGYFYGHPHSHPSLTPTSKSTATGDFPFVYLSLLTVGATAVDRIIIGGDGFEFDNLATSSAAKTPTDDMVFVQEYLDTVTPPDENGGGGDTDGSAGSDTGSLADTGFDPTLALVFAGAAIVAGFTLTVSRRAKRGA